MERLLLEDEDIYNINSKESIDYRSTVESLDEVINKSKKYLEDNIFKDRS